MQMKDKRATGELFAESVWSLKNLSYRNNVKIVEWHGDVVYISRDGT